MRGLYDCIKEDMTKADKMFEKLGYIKNEDKRVIIYKYNQYFNNFKIYKKIYFYKIEKQITFISYNLTEDIKIDFNITMQELQTINEKCKELGWLDKER